MDNKYYILSEQGVTNLVYQYIWKILEYNKVEIDIKETVHAAKKGKRHRGIYKDAIQKNERQLRKSIESHCKEVREHAEKIKHPAVYAVGWGEKSEANQKGLIKKWKKDMKRNAEQAIIEAAVIAYFSFVEQNHIVQKKVIF